MLAFLSTHFINNEVGGMIIAFVDLVPDAIENGAPLDAYPDGVVGGIYYTETAYQGSWVFMGYLLADELAFDSFSMNNGESVSGALRASLLTWEEYE